MEMKPIAMRDALLEQIWQAMEHDQDIYFVTADFGSPVLDKIRSDYPERFKNVGIAEQNLVNISAGLALEGFKVFAYAIAPFITMRCYEQLRVSLALLSEVRPLNVNLIGVGAGYSYVVSGPTHQCYEDLTLMRTLVNFQVLSPSDHISASSLIDNCLSDKSPKYLRLDAQILPQIYTEKSKVYTEKSKVCSHGYNLLRKGNDISILATGYMVHTALEIAERLSEINITSTIIDIIDIQSFNDLELKREVENCKLIVSMEEGFSNRGGLDGRIKQFLCETEIDVKFLSIGVEPKYRFELGSREELHEQVGIGVNVAHERILDFYNNVLEYDEV